MASTAIELLGIGICSTACRRASPAANASGGHRPCACRVSRAPADGRAAGPSANGGKQEILPYLERLHDELDIPVLYAAIRPVSRQAGRLPGGDGPGPAGGPAPAGGKTGSARSADPAEDAGVLDRYRGGPGSIAVGIWRGWTSDGGGQRPVARFIREPPQSRVRVLARDVSLAIGRPGWGSLFRWHLRGQIRCHRRRCEHPLALVRVGDEFCNVGAAGQAGQWLHWISTKTAMCGS